MEQGKAPSLANLARELGISATAVWKFQRRHPDILPWIAGFIDKGNEHYAALVVRRAANLAIQGSAPHADIFLKYRGGVYARDAAGGTGQTSINNGFVINNMVPRPDPPASPALPSAPVVAAIPTVAVR